MKKIILLIPILIFALLLNSCAEEPKKDVYSLKEIYDDSAFGFFVKVDDKFYPVALVDDNHEETFQWYAGEANIPKVTSKTPLVAVFNLNNDMPDLYYIDKYNDLGYTVGANIGIGEDNESLWMSTDNTCEGSNAESVFSNNELDSEIEVESINKIKPYNNIDTDVNIMTGLEKNKYYYFNFFVGTRHYTDIEMCADTRVFKFVERVEITDPFKKTEEQYFIVNLPTNLHKGYYDINGEGLFQL